MRIKSIAILVLVLCFSGCAPAKKSPTVIKIDNIQITEDEFETAFKDSMFSASKNPQARNRFLGQYVTMLLVLREAEKAGLDKDPMFLKSVESFWQQLLMKFELDRKVVELSLDIKVTDEEVQKYYDDHKETTYANESLSSVAENIKWLVLEEKQRKAVNAWLDSLRRNAKIDIDYKALKIER
jgi:hypothetical protein